MSTSCSRKPDRSKDEFSQATGHGTTWDQITKSDEESIHLAKAVLVALRKAGYVIGKVEDGNAPRP